MVENIERRIVDPGREDIESHFKYLIDVALREGWSRVEALKGPQSDTGMDKQRSHTTDGEQAENDQNLIMGSLVVVIDAWDECGADVSQSAKHQTFINTVTKWSRLPKSLKLVVTSLDE